MNNISIEEADLFASYSNRLPEIEQEIEELLKQKNRTQEENEKYENLIVESQTIKNWFKKTSKYEN